MIDTDRRTWIDVLLICAIRAVVKTHKQEKFRQLPIQSVKLQSSTVYNTYLFVRAHLQDHLHPIPLESDSHGAAHLQREQLEFVLPFVWFGWRKSGSSEATVPTSDAIPFLPWISTLKRLVNVGKLRHEGIYLGLEIKAFVYLKWQTGYYPAPFHVAFFQRCFSTETSRRKR